MFQKWPLCPRTLRTTNRLIERNEGDSLNHQPTLFWGTPLTTNMVVLSSLLAPQSRHSLFVPRLVLFLPQFLLTLFWLSLCLFSASRGLLFLNGSIPALRFRSSLYLLFRSIYNPTSRLSLLPWR